MSDACCWRCPVQDQGDCPVCGGKIAIRALADRGGWAAECGCSYVEHPHLTGITLRLKCHARRKGQRGGDAGSGRRDAAPGRRDAVE